MAVEISNEDPRIARMGRDLEAASIRESNLLDRISLASIVNWCFVAVILILATGLLFVLDQKDRLRKELAAVRLTTVATAQQQAVAQELGDDFAGARKEWDRLRGIAESSTARKYARYSNEELSKLLVEVLDAQKEVIIAHIIFERRKPRQFIAAISVVASQTAGTAKMTARLVLTEAGLLLSSEAARRSR